MSSTCGREKWRLYKTRNDVDKHIRENFLYRQILAAEQLFEELKNRKNFGCVQCDFEVPEKTRAIFSKFPLIFKITSVSKNEFGGLMKTYAEEEGTVYEPDKMFTLSFMIQNGTPITPLLLFYLELGLLR